MQPLPGVWGRSPLRRGVLHTPHKWPRQGTSAETKVEGRSLLCRGVLHTPHKWPRQGTSTEEGVEGRSPVCRAQKHTPRKWPRQGINAGQRVPSLVPDGSSEGRMQYAPTAYRKKRPFLPIYLGTSRREKEKGRQSAIPVCRGVLHTPHRRSARIE